MIVSWTDLLISFLLIPVSFMVAYLAGWGIEKMAQPVPATGGLSFYQLFRRSLSGVLTIASLYAIIITRAHTVLLLVPFLVFLWIRFDKNASVLAPVQTVTKNTLVAFCAAGILLYGGYYALHFISFDAQYARYIQSDSIFYGRLANWLNDSGIEKTSIDYLSLGTSAPEPYHYGDVWMIAFLQKTTGISAATLTSLTVYPLFAFIFLLGVAAFAGQFLPYNKTVLAVLLFAGFVKGIAFLYLKSVFGATTWMVSLCSFPKLYLIGALLLAIIMTVRFSHYNSFIAISLAAGMQHILLLTVLAPAVAVWTLLVLVKRKNTIAQLLPGIIATVIAGAYLFYFYVLNVPHDVSQDVSYESTLNKGLGRSNITIIKSIFGQVLTLLPFIGLFFLLTWHQSVSNWIRKQLRFSYSTFILVLCGSGAFLWLVLHPIAYDSFQLLQVIWQPIAAVAITLILAAGFLSKNRLLLGLTLALFLFSAGTGIVRSFYAEKVKVEDVAKIKTLLKSTPDPRFVSLTSTKQFGEVYTYNTVFNQPLSFIDYMIQPYFNMSLNPPYLVIDSTKPTSAFDNSFKQAAPFTRYIKKYGAGAGSDERARAAMKQHHFQLMMIAADTTLPASFTPLAIDSITATQDKSWKIYKIDPAFFNQN